MISIEDVQQYIEEILNRELSGDEILVMGIAFVQGMIAERDNLKQ